MPSIRYVNQTAPFWDFIANLEDQGAQHPFFATQRGNPQDRTEGDSSGDENQTQNPWGSWGPWGPWGPHRGWGRGRGGHHHGGPDGRRGRAGPPADEPEKQPGDGEGEEAVPPYQEKEGEAGPSDEKKGPHCGPHNHPHGPPPHWRGFGGRGGRGGCGGRGGWGGRGGGFGGRGSWGSGPAGGFPPMGPFGFGIPEFLQTHLMGGESGDKGAEDFSPDADVFDTDASFVIHISLPGAKKEDVGVNWDAEKSEVSIAGVVYRPGDEDFLKTLALDERKVGAFEKKVRLGSRANPAQVDVEGITARLEDGILTVEVPKLDKDYVEVTKVDVV